MVITLSDQQRVCLMWAAKGLTAKETAEIMRVATTTVVTHRNIAMRKLRCKTIAQAACMAMQMGLISTEELILKNVCNGG